MTRALLVVLLSAVLSAVLAAAPAEAEEDARQAARAIVESLVQETHAAMVASDREALKAAVSDAFAFDVWERFLVGDRDLTEAERESFRALLPGFLANLYAEHFGKGLEAEPEVTGARRVRRDVLVEARIPRADAEPLPVAYRVRAFEERGPLVIDVMVGGISFLMLKRDEFHAMIERGGAESLLAFMRERAS